jgi:hypothetical protein
MMTPAEPHGQWACPHCDESIGEPVTIRSREWLGDEAHGGMVEEDQECCSVCIKESKLRDCEYLTAADIDAMMEEYRSVLRRKAG